MKLDPDIYLLNTFHIPEILSICKLNFSLWSTWTPNIFKSETSWIFWFPTFMFLSVIYNLRLSHRIPWNFSRLATILFTPRITFWFKDFYKRIYRYCNIRQSIIIFKIMWRYNTQKRRKNHLKRRWIIILELQLILVVH